MESFAANLQRLRKRLGQTQEELAESMGLSSRYIRRLEAGDVDVGLKTLAKFAKYFGIPVTSLLRSARLAPPKRGRPRGSRAGRPTRR